MLKPDFPKGETKSKKREKWKERKGRDEKKENEEIKRKVILILENYKFYILGMEGIISKSNLRISFNEFLFLGQTF